MSGYNGVPAGMTHCEHGCTCGVVDYTHSPTCPALNERCDQAIHAEQNAINYCARYGISTHASQIYVTLAPCISCAKSIISSGITAVIYQADYRDSSGLDLLRRAQLVVHKYDESPTSTASQERGL